MKILKQDTQSILTRVSRDRETYYLALTVMSMFPFENPAELLEEAELWDNAGSLLDKSEFLDIGFPKKKGELLVKGKFFSSGRKPVPGGKVNIKIGSIDKTLYVFGDRLWTKKGGLLNVITHLKPITEMEISYQNAFGGEGFQKNPLGKGYEPVVTKSGETIHPLPNIEAPEDLIGGMSDEPDPAGFSPLDMQWPQRFKDMGTYDQDWLQHRWPYFPDDMDWVYFNAAPEDQRIKDYFKGTESFSILNMNPDTPLIQSRLPGIRKRCFVNKKDGEKEVFKEVKTRLDTVWLFPEIKTGICIWHGAIQAADDEATDILHVYADMEYIDKKEETIEYYHKKFLAMDGEDAEFLEDDLAVEEEGEGGLDVPAVAMPAAAAISATVAVDGMIEEALSAEQIEDQKRLEELQKSQAELEKKLEEVLIGLGVDPVEIEANRVEMERAVDKKLKEEGFGPELTGMVELKEGMSPEDYLDELKIREELIEKEMDELMVKLGIDPSELEKKTDPGMEIKTMLEESMHSKGITSKAPEPVIITEETTDVEIKKKIEKAQAEYDKLLKEVAEKIGLDISKPEAQIEKLQQLESLPTSEMLVSLRENAKSLPGGLEKKVDELIGKIEKLEEAQAKLTEETEQVSEEVSEPEVPEEAAPPEAEAPPEVAAVAAPVEAADEEVEEEPLTREKIVEGHAEGKNFAGQDITGIDLSKLELKGIDFKDANMEGVNLSESVLVGAVFTGADLTRADCSGADFSEAFLDEVSLENANLGKTKFIKANTANSIFTEADLTGADFSEADVTYADFTKCTLDGAVFAKAIAPNATFDGAIGKGIVFSEADLKVSRADEETSFPGADFNKACVDESCWEGADLSGAKFNSSDLNMTDFSRCNLKEADFSLARAERAKFIKADLMEAKMVSTNLFRGDFYKAQLVNTDLRGANMYEAEFLHANIVNTKSDGTNFKMTKLAHWVRKS